MKFAFFFLSLFALSPTYHARYLHDGSFDRRPHAQTVEIIQMVSGEFRVESLDQDATYSQDNLKAPSPPWIPPSRAQEICGRDNPKAPPSPKVAPPNDQATFGRDNKKEPPSPQVTPLNGQTTYSRDKPKGPPSPKQEPPQNQETYGRDKPKAPPPPNVAPPHDQATYGQEDPTLRPNPLGSEGQGMYGGIGPGEQTTLKQADPVLREYIFICNGNPCTGLSTSTAGDDGRNPSLTQAQDITAHQIMKSDEEQWQSIASH